MPAITRNEYRKRLRTFVSEEMQKLPEDMKPKGLRDTVEYNREKAIEFANILQSEGTYVE